jgi:type I restriction enzyme S subunit
MINGLRPYPEMKPSGVGWLGEVPTGWEVHRAKRAFREIDDRSEQGDEELLSVSHKTGVTPRSQKNVTMFMAESYEGHKVCRPGDIVVNTMWAWMAALGVSRQIGIVSPAYGVYRPRSATRFDPKYLDYLLRTEVYRAEYVRSSRGITTSRLRLYPPDFLSIPLIQPPLDEQRLIVRFLDWHGAQTAKLIRAKKQIIALLNEQKQAIIHRAVTRGLDPNVKLKPSGVPWLGDVPAYWEVKRLKDLVRLQSGEGITAFDIEASGEFPVYGGNGLRGYTSRFTHEGDFVLIGRQGALCGNINYASGRFFASEHAVVANPRNKFETRWLGELLRTMNLNQYSIAAAQPGLAVERISPLPIVVPPLHEQPELVRALDTETAELRVAVTRIEREIALIQEFRTRLIADVVTGKLDVRAVAATLPKATELEPVEESEEPEEFDEPDDAEDEEVAA